MSIFVDENIPYLADALKSCDDVISFGGRRLQKKDLQKYDCKYLFVRSTTKINSDLLENTKVEFIGTATSGIDHVDTEFLKRNSIYFVSAPGSNANSVAELVIYSILKWNKIIRSQLQNKVIGIIGFGNIGKIVSKYSNYFKMRILVNDPPLRESNFNFPEYVRYTSPENLLSNSDIITNHVPLTKEGKFPTYKLINSKLINKINRGNLFIHTSRGYVVDEKALLCALKENKFYAAIDVWENEPNINMGLAESTILSTPHIGGYSFDGKLRGAKMMADAFSFFTGLSPDMKEINDKLSSYHSLEEEKFTNLDFIFETLKENRRFEDDHKKLLKTFKLDDNERAKAFDLLRKNYPIRRESL